MYGALEGAMETEARNRSDVCNAGHVKKGKELPRRWNLRVGKTIRPYRVLRT
jgi:hypothetical protein